jgi:hypothetical protein
MLFRSTAQHRARWQSARRSGSIRTTTRPVAAGRGWRGWRRRSERGASLVEFAVVAPVLFLLLFGVIDFGGLYSKQIGFRSGLRASTRQAVIARFGTDNSCPTAGLSSSSESVKRLVCSVKKSVGLDPETTRVKLRLVDGNEDGVAEHKAYDDLMICVMAKPSSITGFFDSLFASTALKARLQMMIEKGKDEVPGMILLENSQETPLPDSNWEFCDPAVPAP